MCVDELMDVIAVSFIFVFYLFWLFLLFFFFQAEDGIRDWSVTGVQTCALPISTGGTTGQPKIAKLSNRNMVASAVASMLAINLTPSDRALVALPLFHVGGAFVGSLASLAAGDRKSVV